MTSIYVDATTVIALGTVGELELLTAFDGECIILLSVQAEVTTEPARTNLTQLCDQDHVASTPNVPINDDQAMEILDESQSSGDVAIIGAVLAHRTTDTPVAVVSDDQRVRTVARGFNADVTGTIGTIVRAVEESMPEDEAKAIVRRIDEHGLHMTADLRTKAEELIETAASEDSR